MEHIEEDVKVFRNFYNSLQDNGILLISTPSDKGGSDVHNEEEESFIDEHVRDGYSIKDISEKLSLAGFRNIEASYTYGKPGNISWRLSMKYPDKDAQSFICILFNTALLLSDYFSLFQLSSTFLTFIQSIRQEPDYLSQPESKK